MSGVHGDGPARGGSLASRGLAALRREPWLAAIVVLMAVMDSVERVVRYANFAAGLDLSIFDQAIWHYSRFEAPYSTIKGSDLLGDHFHPLIAVFGPLYWIWSDPRLLLIASSVVVACSVVPVFLFARRRVPRLPAYLIAVAYALFWGLQEGMGYDFHESELGPLLIALTILFADERRWGWMYFTAALTLGVKEDLSLFVAFLGLYLLTIREWRRGAVLIAVGIAWFELTTHVFIPALSPKGAYAYWSYGDLGRNLPDAIWALAKAPWRVFTIGFSPGAKAHTLLYLFAPFLFLTLCSRLFILAIPLLAERFLSTRTAFWGTSFQFSLTISPVLAMGATVGLANLQRWAMALTRRGTPAVHPRLWGAHARGVLVAASAAMAVTSLVLTLTISDSPPRELLRTSFYSSPPWAAAAERAMAHVPPHAPVTANDILLTHLMHRDFATEIAVGWGLGGYLIANLGEPVGQPTGDGNFAVLGQVLTGELSRTTPIYFDEDWLVAKLPPPGQKPTNGILTPLPFRAGQELVRLTGQWHIGFVSGLEATFRCYLDLAGSSRTARGCFARVRASFGPVQQMMTQALLDARRLAAGPCAVLASEAHEAIGLVGGRLLELDLLGERGGGPLFTANARTINSEIDQRDLPGRLDRFVTLCYPRGAVG